MKSINYLRGVSRVTVSDTPESVINRVSDADIRLWNVEKTDDGTAFSVHTKNLRAVLSMYPEASVQSRGMPQKLRALRKRALVPILALLLVCAWMLSGLLVWEFQIEGCVNVDEFEILRVLDEHGVTYGAVGALIDSQSLSNIVLCEIPELAWFAINVNGSRAVISVRERVPVPEIVDPNQQTSVYAEKAGLIADAVVYDGTKMVSVGQQVQAGDILVSGITRSYTGVRSEHALARIYAQTEYEFTAEMPKSCSSKVYTGEDFTRYGINICGNRFDLRLGDGAEENCDRTEHEQQLVLFGASLPVWLVTTEFERYELESGSLTTEQCAEILKDELSARLISENTGDVLWSDFEVCDNGDTVSVTLRAHCYERIG